MPGSFPAYSGNGFVDLMLYANSVSNNMAGVGLIVMVWLVLLIAMIWSTNSFMKAVAVSSYVAFMLSLLLATVGIVTSSMIVLTLIIAFVATMLIRRND